MDAEADHFASGEAEKFGDRFEVSQDGQEARAETPDVLDFIGDNAASLKPTP